jgi:DNA-binding SARP family transcriptional activator
VVARRARSRTGAPADQPVPWVSIRLCGTFEVEVDGERRESRLASPQARALFGLLADRRHGAMSRDAIADALWGDAPPPSRDASLRALLSGARRVLGPDSLPGRGDVRLQVPGEVLVDVEVARAAVETAERALAAGVPADARAAAAQAAGILEEELLPGLSAPWIDDRRTELEALGNQALELEAWAALAAGEPAAAERAARRLTERAPFREAGHEALMRALAEQGDVAAALLVHEHLRTLLREELGTAPSAPVGALHRELLDGGPGAARPALTLPRPRGIRPARAAAGVLVAVGAGILVAGLLRDRSPAPATVAAASPPGLVVEGTVRTDGNVSFRVPAGWGPRRLPAPGVTGAGADGAGCNVFDGGLIRAGTPAALRELTRHRVAAAAGSRAAVGRVPGDLPAAWATTHDAGGAGRIAVVAGRGELYRIECRGPPGAWSALDRSAFRPLISSFRVASA